VTFSLILVSEREPDGSWEDCVWASGVMIANVMVGENRYPATRAEYESLRYAGTGVREASGDGSNYPDELVPAMLKRYRLSVRCGVGWAEGLDEMPVGSWGAWQGKYSKLPGRLRLTGFTGGHSFVVKRDRSTSCLLYDPLSTTGAAPSRITLDELRAYYSALPGAHWIAAYEREAWRQPMIVYSLERWKVPVGTAVYETPNGAIVTRYSGASEVTTIGYPNDRSADGRDYGWRAVLVTTKALDQISGLKIAFIRRPTGDPISTSPTWDAAVKKVLFDPTFTGSQVIDATTAQIEAAKDQGFVEGRDAAVAAGSKVQPS